MIPGSNHVVACGRCGAMAQYRTLATESQLYSSLWTDGCVTGPLLNPQRVLFVCRNCHHLQWMHEVDTVRIYETWDMPETPRDDEKWYHAPLMIEPIELHYYRALQFGMASERYGEMVLRMAAWRRHNDEHRSCGVASVLGSIQLAGSLFDDARSENRERLGRLLRDEEGIEQILYAELLRQDGQFGAALDVLALTDTNVHPPLAKGVRERCLRRDTLLGEVGRKR